MSNPPHSNIPPRSFGCSSLATVPPLQYSSDELNVEFISHVGSSSSSSPFPLSLDECYNIQQTPYTFTSSSSSSAPASTYVFTNMTAPVEESGTGVQQYLMNNNYDQMIGVPSWWPLHGGDEMGNTEVQQQTYSATTTTCSSAPTCLASWMDQNQSMPLTLQYSPYTQDLSLFPSLEHMGYGFVLQKELRNSDVNNIGRIVLPKRESESTLPFLSVKEGIQLSIMELFNPCVWRMRYRFWPNNKSRMYVLENTGEFIRRHGLKCGDYIAIYQDMSKQLYICSRRVERPLLEENPTPSSTTTPVVTAAQMTSNAVVDMQTMEEQGQATRDSFEMGSGFFDTSLESGDNSFQFTDPSTSLFDTARGDHYSTRHLESLPNIEDCDLSIYDVVPEKTTGGDHRVLK